MTPTGAIPTGSPWPALKEYTQDHPAGSQDPLKFEPDVALDLSSAASQVVMAINGLKQFIGDLNAAAPLSNLGSGRALGVKFGKQADTLDKIFDQHKSILGDMIETFVAAGKAYGNMDGFNSGILDNVKSKPDEKWEFDGMPTTTPPLTPPADATAGTLPEAVTALKSFEPTTIKAENPEGMDWLDLYNVGEFIRTQRVVANLSDAAGTWKWMGRQIGEAFNDFVNKVDSVTEEQWSGPGKEIAVAAVKVYAQSVPALAATAEGFGELLHGTAKWLDSTQRWMPPTPDNPAGTIYSSGASFNGSTVVMSSTIVTDETGTYRENFRKTYVTGMTQSSTHVPVLPPAEGAFGKIPSDPYKPAGRPDDGGGGRRTGGGGGGGGRAGGGGGGGGGQPGGEGPAPGARELFSDGRSPATEVSSSPVDSRRSPADLGSFAQQLGGIVAPGAQQSPGRQQRVPGARQVAGPAGALVPGSAAEDQFLDAAAKQLMAAAQQGLPQLQQLFAQLAQSLTPEQQRELLKKAGLEGIPGLEVHEPAEAGDPTALETLTAALGGGAGGGPGGGGGSGGGFGSGAGTFLAQDPSKSSKLFPRVAAFGSFDAGTQYESGARSPAATAGTPGAPGSPGAAGAAGANQGGGQHKRASYLESTEHLEGALGEAPVVVRPVVER